MYGLWHRSGSGVPRWDRDSSVEKSRGPRLPVPHARHVPFRFPLLQIQTDRLRAIPFDGHLEGHPRRSGDPDALQREIGSIEANPPVDALLRPSGPARALDLDLVDARLLQAPVDRKIVERHLAITHREEVQRRDAGEPVAGDLVAP